MSEGGLEEELVVYDGIVEVPNSEFSKVCLSSGSGGGGGGWRWGWWWWWERE